MRFKIDPVKRTAKKRGICLARLTFCRAFLYNRVKVAIYMGVNYFTKEQIEELRDNPYIRNISEKAITYSEEFHEEFYFRYSNGERPSDILLEMGINPRALGERRVSNIVQRCKAMANRGSFEDTRKNSSGRPRLKERTMEEELEYLRHQVEYQKQEIEALKKIKFVEKKQAWKQRKKNTK